MITITPIGIISTLGNPIVNISVLKTLFFRNKNLFPIILHSILAPLEKGVNLFYSSQRNVMDYFSLTKLQHIPSKTLEEILNQLKIDHDKFEDDIFEIEQELLIRELPYCKPIIDLIK